MTTGSRVRVVVRVDVCVVVVVNTGDGKVGGNSCVGGNVRSIGVVPRVELVRVDIEDGDVVTWKHQRIQGR